MVSEFMVTISLLAKHIYKPKSFCSTDVIVRDGLLMLPPEYLELFSTLIGLLLKCQSIEEGVPEVIIHCRVTVLDSFGEYLVIGVRKSNTDGPEINNGVTLIISLNSNIGGCEFGACSHF